MNGHHLDIRITRILTVIFISSLAVLISFSTFKKSALKRNKKITLGTVANPSIFKGGSSAVDFYYTVGGKKYKGSAVLPISDHALEEFLKKLTTYQVVYDSTNPSNADILITPLKYEEYSVPIPDSLKYFW